MREQKKFILLIEYRNGIKRTSSKKERVEQMNK